MMHFYDFILNYRYFFLLFSFNLKIRRENRHKQKSPKKFGTFFKEIVYE